SMGSSSTRLERGFESTETRRITISLRRGKPQRLRGDLAVVRGSGHREHDPEPDAGGPVTTFPGITHVAVTVTDLDRSREWYRRLLGSDPVLDEDAGAFYHVVFVLDGGTLLGLHTLEGTPAGDRFDERRVGLDHVSFTCANRAELDRWAARLDEL